MEPFWPLPIQNCTGKPWRFYRSENMIATKTRDGKTMADAKETVSGAENTRQQPKPPYGHLSVVCGPMFAGKTTETLKRILWAKNGRGQIDEVSVPTNRRKNVAIQFSRNGDDIDGGFGGPARRRAIA